jgi:hypothetical protein
MSLFAAGRELAETTRKDMVVEPSHGNVKEVKVCFSSVSGG